MKHKLIGGLTALATVSVLALAFSSSFTPQRSASVVQRMSSVDAPPQNKFGFAEALEPAASSPDVAADAAADAATAASQAAIAASDAARSGRPADDIPSMAIAADLPKVAYTYRYGYRVDGEQISALQRAHADACEKQGPRTCRILSLEQSGAESGGFARGTLELAVAADRARGFGNDLARSVKAVGGSEVSTAISGEDLSKNIVDTEARLRARTVLRDRLMEVLASRKGTVAELVEAERGVAQVNEEIDEARSWLAEMQGRVQFSRITIVYASNAASLEDGDTGGFLAPIRSMLGNVGAILGTVIAMLIALLTTVLPIGLAGWGLFRLWRKYRPARQQPAELEGG